VGEEGRTRWRGRKEREGRKRGIGVKNEKGKSLMIDAGDRRKDTPKYVKH